MKTTRRTFLQMLGISPLVSLASIDAQEPAVDVPADPQPADGVIRLRHIGKVGYRYMEVPRMHGPCLTLMDIEIPYAYVPGLREAANDQLIHTFALHAGPDSHVQFSARVQTMRFHYQHGGSKMEITLIRDDNSICFFKEGI